MTSVNSSGAQLRRFLRRHSDLLIPIAASVLLSLLMASPFFLVIYLAEVRSYGSVQF
jgi:hypothetical protein